MTLIVEFISMATSKKFCFVADGKWPAAFTLSTIDSPLRFLCCRQNGSLDFNSKGLKEKEKLFSMDLVSSAENRVVDGLIGGQPMMKSSKGQYVRISVCARPGCYLVANGVAGIGLSWTVDNSRCLNDFGSANSSRIGTSFNQSIFSFRVLQDDPIFCLQV